MFLFFAFLLNFGAACNVCRLKCTGFVITPTSHVLNIDQKFLCYCIWKHKEFLMCLMNFDGSKIHQTGCLFLAILTALPLSFQLLLLLWQIMNMLLWQLLISQSRRVLWCCSIQKISLQLYCTCTSTYTCTCTFVFQRVHVVCNWSQFLLART